MLSKNSPKISKYFECIQCDYTCYKNSDYEKHCLTKKHNAIIAGDNAIPTIFTCHCGNQYKHRSSFYRHKKDCNPVEHYIDPAQPSSSIPVPAVQLVDASVVLELLKQNQDFKDLILEQNKQMIELMKNTGNTTNNTNNTTNTNCHNKFNLNVFLNETCKDAISMDDFINSLEVTRDDFIRTGNVGFVQGMSSVLVKRIRNMELHTRPMHCTDLKRETVYIKNEDKWEKEDMDKTHLRKAVKNVARKNMNELKRWVQDSKPEVETHGTTEYEDYFKYYKSALGGYDREEDKEFEEKIIKNVLKEVQVDKTITAI